MPPTVRSHLRLHIKRITFCSYVFSPNPTSRRPPGSPLDGACRDSVGSISCHLDRKLFMLHNSARKKKRLFDFFMFYDLWKDMDSWRIVVLMKKIVRNNSKNN